MKDLISVIVPVYNSERYLPNCLRSIVDQSYDHLEIILIDDGSSDGSLKICKEFAEKDSRIRVFHQENKGPSAAMNRGLDLAQGDLYAIVDCDDCLHPQMYEVLYNNLLAYNADISVCAASDVYEEEEFNINNINMDENINVFEGLEVMETLYSELHAINVVVWNKLYKKEIFANLRFEDGKWHEDEFIVHRILDQAKRVVYSDLSLYFYLRRDTSFMGRKFNLTRLDYLEALEDRMIFFKTRNLNELYEKTLVNYLNMIPTHYFLVQEFFPDEKDILEDLKVKYKNEYQNTKKLPQKLNVKYNLFCISPLLYRFFRSIWIRSGADKISA